ncbi:MAG: ATP-dependent DNA helicase RecG [Dehalococcoidia bacterium]|nr:MAG: ATP-dependent DNA helicase RecG [Dehalococcoidia bacterium]
MPIDFSPLRKILQLEQKKGYSNSAVFGGLDGFLAKWTSQNKGKVTDLTLLKTFSKLPTINYSSLNTKQRRQQIENIIRFIDSYDRTIPENKTIPPLLSNKRSSTKQMLSTTSSSIDSPITNLKGISSNLATKFARLNVYTIRNLLYFFPNRHLDYSRLKTISELTEGNEETIVANIWQVREVKLGGRRSTEAIIGDETGNVRVVWFNNPYMVKQLSTNKRVVISGRLGIFKHRPVFQSPEWELLEDKELTHTGRLVPLYPLTRGLYPRQVRKLMKEIIDDWSAKVNDFLPVQLRQRCNLLELSQAIYQAHFPDDEELKKRARIRLAFDELFILQLGVLNRKQKWQENQIAVPFIIETPLLESWLKSLPFTPTTAQERVINELLVDLEKSKPTSRLLQGEVGSGKTVVAMTALLMAVANSCQGAFMAPTEILSEQHFISICNLLAGIGKLEIQEEFLHTYSGLLLKPITIALLIGDIKGTKKRELQQLILNGEIDITIGTHALIQKEVAFKKLGFIVVDEQHRFGVTQRSALRQKGLSPHMLVMTATPIPRTLALTLYGDLDLSVIDQLPPSRQEIKTKWIKPIQRDKAYNFIRRQVAEGRQAFIICPLIEESEAIQAKAATAEFEHLSKEVFPNLRLGLLHGRMSAAEKDDKMCLFRSCQLDILVSTPVVEVGIDIPNATVMLIESADRFGLSQLHQFRGRVGRGKEQSYCLLLAENPSEVARERLDIIEQVHDGFQLAEEDLKMRGPGEFFGTRQSGIPDLRMAKISDVPLLELARKEASLLFKDDPELKNPRHQLLVKELARIWPEEDSEWS